MDSKFDDKSQTPSDRNPKWKLVTTYDVDLYKCGARVGDQLTLRSKLVVKDSHGRPTGKVFLPGEPWRVMRGSSQDLQAIWLSDPDGDPHTWKDDSDFWLNFERVA